MFYLVILIMHAKGKYYIGIFIAIFSPLTLISQILPLDHYNVKDGLPSNWITTIYQDTFGYIWLGTDEGISKFDGILFTTYGYAEGLPVNHVWTITESKKEPGTLFVGTHGGGLVKYSDGRFKQVKLGEGIAINVVVSILEDEDGGVWCATHAGIVRVVDDVPILSDEFEKVPVSFIVRDKSEFIWIGIEKVIYKLNSNFDILVRYSLPLTVDDSISGFQIDRDNDIWMGTSSGKILLMRETEKGTIIQISSTLIGKDVLNIVEDEYGYIWIAHSEKGMFTASKNDDIIVINRFSTENGLISNKISYCFVDYENNLWIGNYSHGLSKLSARNVYYFYFEKLYPPGAVIGDRLYVAADGGIAEVWKPSPGMLRKELHILSDGSPTGEPISVVAIPDGKLAVMYTNAIALYGINIPDNEKSEWHTIKLFSQGKEIPEGKLVALDVDTAYTIWCFIGDRVFVLNTENEELSYYFSKDDGLPGNDTRKMLLDRNGNLWFGDFNHGMALFKKSGDKMMYFKKITEYEGLPSNSIRALFQRKNGDILVGTRFGGIAVINGEEIIRTISVEDGLLSNGVWEFSEDGDERLWIATSLGINMLAAGNSSPNTLNKLSGLYIGSVGTLPGGTVWGVGRNELILYSQQRDNRGNYSPPISITELRVNGIESIIKPGLVFSHNENLLVFNFIGISYRDSHNLHYKYRLLGLDTLWIEQGDSRSVTYGSLPPGNYTFEVIALTSDSVASSIPASLSFVISPPVWKQWWFFGLSMLILFVLVEGVMQIRVRRLLHIERLRSSIATDLHDDIGAGLTHIGLLSEVLIRKYKTRIPEADDRTSGRTNDPDKENLIQDNLIESIERMGSISRELSSAMSDVVWSINPKFDSLDSLLKRISSFAHEVCRSKNIQLHFNIPLNVEKIKLNPEVRRNLLLIMKEALTNAVKYSQSSSIEVIVEYLSPMLTFSIQDFGIGFDIDLAGDGNGIPNIRSRAKRINGLLTIESVHGKGTLIKVILDIR